MAEHKIIPAPIKGINLARPEQTLFPELGYARDIVNMLPTKRSTLRKRPGYRYLDREPEGVVPLDFFEFGAIGDSGLVPVVIWVGHQEVRIISTILLYPNNFTVEAGAGQVGLNWTLIPDALEYEVEYKKSSATGWIAWEPAGGITGDSEIVTGLDDATEYQFRLRSKSGLVVSNWSPPETATTVFASSAPDDPTNLRETVEPTAFTPRWNLVGNAIDYQVRYREGNSGPWTTISNITGNSRRITGLDPLTQYEWQVRARNDYNTESFSARVPSNPREFTTLPEEIWFVANRTVVRFDESTTFTWPFSNLDSASFQVHGAGGGGGGGGGGAGLDFAFISTFGLKPAGAAGSGLVQRCSFFS